MTAPKRTPQALAAPEGWYENDTQGVNVTWDLGIWGTGDPDNNLKLAVFNTGEMTRSNR